LGILDIFSSGPKKAIRLKLKVTQKYGGPEARQKAIQQLGEMKFPEAVTSLLARFTITVDPLTTDEDEKQHVFDLVKGFGPAAIDPVKNFLKRSDSATSWALKLLSALVPETEVVGICVDLLARIGPEYTRDPEKKTVLMHFLEGKDDPRIAPALLPFLEDPSDDVKIAALKGLALTPHEQAREPILKLLTAADTARRVQMAAITALQQTGLGVQGFREKVEALVPEQFFVDKAGAIKKRG
jgi:HEAT repeat protein